MKVAFITEHFPPEISGVAHSAERIVKNLHAVGVQITVFTVDYNDEFVNPYTFIDRAFPFPVHRMGPFSRRRGNRQGSIASERKNQFATLRNLVLTQQPDLLHCFYLLNPGFYGALLKQEMGIPFIASIRGNDLSRDFFDYSKWPATDFVVRMADRVTVVNGFLSEMFARFFPAAVGKLVTIENSITGVQETDEVAPIAELEGKFVIGNVAMIREKKGIQNLLRVFASLARENPSLHLLLVGDIAKVTEREGYTALIDNLGISKRLTVTGTVAHSQVPAYLKMMNVFAMPSIDDGLANSLLEAMLAGLPILASDVFASTLKHEHDCLMFKRHDLTELEAQLHRLISNPTLRNSLAGRVAITAADRFDSKRETREYLNLYRQFT